MHNGASDSAIKNKHQFSVLTGDVLCDFKNLLIKGNCEILGIKKYN